MKKIYFYILFLFAASTQSVLAADFIWTAEFNYATRTGSSPGAACSAAFTAGNNNSNSVYLGPVRVSDTRFNCQWKSGPTTNVYAVRRSGDSCPANKTFQPSTGECKYEDPLNCAAKAGQETNWRAEYPSISAYDENPIRCTTSQGGCAVDVCDSGSHTCQTDGQTGKFVCTGKGGKYTGDPQIASSGPGVDGCEGIACESKPPQESSSDQNCTAPSASNGVTTYTCVSESNSNEWSNSNCAVGNVNGVQGLHCTSPDYVPEYDGKTRTDDVAQETNPDGGKTTSTTTTDDRTHCQAGKCTSSSTSSTTTTTTDGNGNVTGETSTCKGANCGSDGKPTEPDEEEEDEQSEEAPLPSGSINGPDVSGALPEIGGDGDKDMTDSTAAYFDRIASAPIVESFTSIAVPTGGSCNIGSASLFGGTVSFNKFCEFAPEVLSGLRYLFLAIWAWAAIRLFGTA